MAHLLMPNIQIPEDGLSEIRANRDTPEIRVAVMCFKPPWHIYFCFYICFYFFLASEEPADVSSNWRFLATFTF